MEEVFARLRIAEVKARYCRFLDTKDWAKFALLFTEDAVLDVSEDTGLPPIAGRQALVGMVGSVVEHARTAHQVHSPEIVFDGPDAAEVIWAMQDRVVWAEGKSPVAGASALTGYGHYHERYVRHGEDWRIASLKLTRLIVEFGN
jgi:hypothetical protein